MFCCLCQEMEPRPKEECAWRLPRTYRVSSRTNGCLRRKRECFCFHCGQWVASSTHFTGNAFYLQPLSLWLERKSSWAKKYSLSFSKYHVTFSIKVQHIHCSSFKVLLALQKFFSACFRNIILTYSLLSSNRLWFMDDITTSLCSKDASLGHSICWVLSTFS